MSIHARDAIEDAGPDAPSCDWHGLECKADLLIGAMLWLCLECAEDLGYELSAWRFRKGDDALREAVA